MSRTTVIDRQKKFAMNKWIVFAFSLALAACGSSNTSNQPEERAAVEPYSYVLDGQPTSEQALRALTDQGIRLTYVAPVGENSRTIQMFSSEAGFMTFKQQQDQKIEAQGLCISLRTKSTFYDGENYVGSTLTVSKGSTYEDLSLVSHLYGPWDNDISSVKGADCVYTYLYPDAYRNGIRVVVPPGSKLDKMPSGYDTGPGLSTISSLQVP